MLFVELTVRMLELIEVSLRLVVLMMVEPANRLELTVLLTMLVLEAVELDTVL